METNIRLEQYGKDIQAGRFPGAEMMVEDRQNMHANKFPDDDLESNSKRLTDNAQTAVLPKQECNGQAADSDRQTDDGQTALSGRQADDGQEILQDNIQHYKIHLLSVIGEIEGHECLGSSVKSTKYEHVLPQLAALEDNKEMDGLLMLLNTVGGDIEAGLAIAEMIASLSVPSVSLVLGGCHSIGVPLAVSTDYSFIVPSGAMLIHPVRMNGMVIGAPQTYEYFTRLQNRITGFVAAHSNVSREAMEQMMLETGEMTKDLGTILVGEDAVQKGLIHATGGIHEALEKLYELIRCQQSLCRKTSENI